MSDFIHGVSMTETGEGIPSAGSPATSIIGIVGVFGDVSEDTAAESDKPYLIMSAKEAVKKFGDVNGTHSLPRFLKWIFRQGNAKVVCVGVKVPANASEEQIKAAIAGSQAEGTGMWALLKATSTTGVTPKILIAPHYSSDANIADTLYSVANRLRAIAILDAGNGEYNTATAMAEKLPWSRQYLFYPYLDVVDPEDSELVIEAKKAASTAMEALQKTIEKIAETDKDLADQKATVANESIPQPDRDAASDKIKKLESDLTKLRTKKDQQTQAKITTENALIEAMKSGQIVQVPATPFVAGTMVQVQKERGFWKSPSNVPIQGAVGVSRNVDFIDGDPACLANVLNSNRVNTFIQYKGGIRVWGNRTCGQGREAYWKFVTDRIVADYLIELIKDRMFSQVDEFVSAGLLKTIEEDVNAAIRNLKAKGALLGGKAWIDEELNSPDAISAGGFDGIYWNFDFTPPPPAERLNFKAIITTKYIAEAFQ